MKNSKRRGAVKVPNVILRPAQASTSRSTQEDINGSHVTSQEGEPEVDIDITVGNKPFSGIVLCATGDLDKRILFDQAQEMGAARSNDFTDQVTHLVADAPGSAKYKCAVERNLPILTPSWVEEAYNIWLNGDVVNFNELLEKHRLPIFTGVRLCITGMDDMESRAKIHSILTKQGGTYLKVLDTTVTHLLCSTLESPKIEWTHNYNRTQKVSKRIRMVWEEWFWDSLEFGGQWNEVCYDVSTERPTRQSPPEASTKAQTWTESMPSLTSSQHTPLPQSIPTESLLNDDAADYGQTIKQRHVGLRILESLVQARGSNKGEDPSRTVVKKLSVTDVLIPPKEPQVSVPNTLSRGAAGPSSVLTLLSNQRVTSFTSPVPQPQARQPFRRVTSSANNAPLLPQSSLMNVASSSTTPGCPNLFAGQSFRAYGEANGEVLRNVVEKHGGRWIEDEGEDVNFILVRLVDGTVHWRCERDEERRAKYRTECWMEHCVFEERICGPDEHVSFTPLKIDTPVEGADKLTISMSGLDSEETCWTKRLIRVVGGSIPQKFSRRSTHLICPAFSGDKYEKAKEWHVQVVDLAWLHHIVNKGNIPYAANLGEKTATPSEERVVGRSPSSTQLDTKGKGKLKDMESEGAMVDITNGHSQGSSSLERVSLPISHSANPSLGQTKRFKTEGGQLSHFQSPDARSTHDPSTSTAADPVISFGQPMLLSGTAPQTSIAPSSVSPTVSPLSRAHYTPSQKSVAEGKVKLTVPIPSSVSPSPLKTLSKSPSVLSSTAGETLGMMTAITALLGKRGADVKDETDPTVSKDQGRMIKRPRPARQNTDMALGAIVSPGLKFINEASSQSYLIHQEDDAFMEEGQSLRVRYEDPAQRAEKDRLISLFEQKPQNEGVQCGQDGDGEPDNYISEKKGSAAPRTKKKLLRRTNRSSGCAN